MSGLGVALLPDRAGSERLIAASETLSRAVELRQPLNLADNLPHLSLIHMVDLPPDSLAPIERRFGGTKQDLKAPLQIETDALSVVPVGWLFLDAVRSPALYALHNAAFENFKEFLAPPKQARDLSQLTAEERISFLAYGYRYIGPAFRPHFTLGRAKSALATDLRAIELFRAGLELSITFRIRSMVLFDIGPDGACKNVRAEHALG